MRGITCLRFLGFCLALLVFPLFAAAQDSVKCESDDGNRKYCGNYDSNQVRLERQISGSACVQGRSSDARN